LARNLNPLVETLRTLTHVATAGRVYLVDDDAGVLRALRRLLTAEGLDVETFSSATEFLNRQPMDVPACLVIDQRMPEVTGLQVQQAIRDAGAGSLSVVFITGHSDVPTTVEAMKRGAVDFLIKPVEADALMDAINRALERSAQIVEATQERENFLSRLRLLTPRERQVGARVIRGLLNKQIAWELGTAEKTVKVHRGRLMQKMGVHSVAELARLAERTNVTFDIEE
jgi:FixJ family two-component response regulator